MQNMKNYSLYKVKKAFACICLTSKRFSMKQFCAFFLDYARPGVSLFALRPKTQRSAMTGAIALLAKSSIYSMAISFISSSLPCCK